MTKKSSKSILYCAEQVRELDRIAISEHGIPGITLMRRAGLAAFNELRRTWPNATRISVWCGVGNNGGDGYIVAGLAKQRNLKVQLIQVGDATKLKGDAKAAHDWASDAGVDITRLAEFHALDGDVVVDALLGTGLAGTVRAEYAEAIKKINSSALPVIALDIPSGLCSDTGTVLGVAVTAQLTVTFIGLKRGLYTGKGREYSGDIVFTSLDVPTEIYDQIKSGCRLIENDLPRQLLRARSAASHKGDFGHVLILGGAKGFGGAALMASRSAARVGAGLVSLATDIEHVTASLVGAPEIMVQGVRSYPDLLPLLKNASCLVVGPGLGQTAWSEQLCMAAFESGLPAVVDADALNLLSANRVKANRRQNWILTPHPGEAARLLSVSVQDVEADRFGVVCEIQRIYGGVVILKGSGTLVCSGDADISVCVAGNPGMASGGMGDVLSGVLGGLLAQGVILADTARLGVLLHACAADIAAQQGQRGLLATDLLLPLKSLVNPERQSA